MSPVETFEMRRRILNLCLTKPRYNAETIFKTLVLFIYGDVQYTTDLFCKNVLKVVAYAVN